MRESHIIRRERALQAYLKKPKIRQKEIDIFTDPNAVFYDRFDIINENRATEEIIYKYYPTLDNI